MRIITFMTAQSPRPRVKEKVNVKAKAKVARILRGKVTKEAKEEKAVKRGRKARKVRGNRTTEVEADPFGAMRKAG